MQRILVTRRIPQVGIDRLQKHFEVDVWEDSLPPSRNVLIERAQACSGILSLLSDSLDGAVMDAIGPSLQAIANYAVGYNNIDIGAAKERGIAVGNTPDVLTDATADVAVGLMLAAARRFQESIEHVRNLEWSTWEPMGLLGQELGGKTLGIVGMGRIGMAVAKRCYGGWGMKVLYTARNHKPLADQSLGAVHVSFDQLLASSDFISVHTDLNVETKHLFNRARFAQMKKNAVFVNTARGGIIDQNALYDALTSGSIFAAGLDVTDPEPLPDVSPLRRLSNCLILPHIGSATFQAREAMAIMAADNLVAALQGKPMPYPV